MDIIYTRLLFEIYRFHYRPLMREPAEETEVSWLYPHGLRDL